MARKRKSSTVSVSMNDVLFVVLGAVTNYALINPLINKVSDKIPLGDQKGKILTAAKGLGAAYAAFKLKKLPKEARLAMFGVSAASGVELAGQVLPDKMVALNGTGDLYSVLGNTEVLELPINPAGELAGAGASGTISDEGIATFGVGDLDTDEIAMFGTGGDFYDESI